MNLMLQRVSISALICYQFTCRCEGTGFRRGNFLLTRKPLVQPSHAPL